MWHKIDTQFSPCLAIWKISLNACISNVRVPSFLNTTETMSHAIHPGALHFLSDTEFKTDLFLQFDKIAIVTH
jgi:hypothetical protein